MNSITMKKTFLFFFLATVLFACNQQPTNSLPNYSGRPGEIIIVSTKPQWEGAIGDTLNSYLRSFQYGLPQSEPLFDLVNTNKRDFENVFKTFRNVIIIEIDQGRMSKGEVKFHKNAYAQEQFLATVTASSQKEILELLAKNKNKIINYYNNKELSRLAKKNRIKGSKESRAKIQEKYKLALTLNEGAEFAKSDSNILWLRSESERVRGGFQHQISQGILMYCYPYYDTVQLSDESVLKMRDYFLKKNIEGSRAGSYVTTDYKYIPPQVAELNFKGNYAKEVRGLWEMENGYMGGPMYSLTVLDEKNGRIIGLAGYVYAPEFDKRELIREVEAVIKSLDLKVKKPLPKKKAA